MRHDGGYTLSDADVDGAAQILAGRGAQAVPLRSEPFLLEATGIALGDLDVLVGRVSPLLLRGVVPADRVWVVFPVTPFLVNGRRIATPIVAVLGEGAALDWVNHADADWALVSLPAGLAARALESPARSPRPGPGGQLMLACDPDVWRQSIELLQSAAEVAARDATVFEVAEARRSLRSSVLETLQDLLAGLSRGERPRVLRAAAERQRLLAAAEALLHAEPGQVPTAPSMAAALGVSVPRLRRAIRAQYGMDVQRYLLLRRLMRVHAALRSVVPSPSMLRQIALAHGFPDLDQLEREYRAIFAAGFSWFQGDASASDEMSPALLRLAAD